MCLSKIRFFEKRNDLSITVYRFENETLQNVYHSKNRTSRRKIKLLLLLEGQKSHYCLIKNFSNLMHQLHRSSKKRCKGPKSKFCGNCFQPIIRLNYRKHIEFCEDHKPLEITMPQCDTTLSFNNWQKNTMVSFCCLCRLGSYRCPECQRFSTNANDFTHN